MKITHSQEEYLKVIYILSNTEKEVRVTDIAKKLNITKPSVNKAIKSLNEINMINYQTYGNITLTEEGKSLAKAILKKYDITKMFLTEILKVPIEKAEEDAKAIKSAISEETEKSLEEYIIKILKLDKLECNCNMDNEKCRKCVRITAENRLKK